MAADGSAARGEERFGGLTPESRRRAAKIRLILLDSDGVLTDGRLYTGCDGEDMRSFDVKDGHGIVMGRDGGLMFGIISGREAAAVTRRAAELRIGEVHQSVRDKRARLEEILQRLDLPAEAVCYVGDDLIDLPVMRHVGFAVAPADAVPEVLESAHYVTRRPGGRGAVREVIDLVLRESGNWDSATRRYFA